MSLCMSLWRAEACPLIEWQARPQRRLPPYFPRPSGELGQNQKQQLVILALARLLLQVAEKIWFFSMLPLGSGERIL